MVAPEVNQRREIVSNVFRKVERPFVDLPVVVADAVQLVLLVLRRVETRERAPPKQTHDIGVLCIAACLVPLLVVLRVAAVHLLAGAEVGRDHPVDGGVVRRVIDTAPIPPRLDNKRLVKRDAELGGADVRGQEVVHSLALAGVVRLAHGVTWQGRKGY